MNFFLGTHTVILHFGPAHISTEARSIYFHETLAPPIKFLSCHFLELPLTHAAAAAAVATAPQLASSPVADMVRRFSSSSHSPHDQEYVLGGCLVLGVCYYASREILLFDLVVQ